jgi:hypothetical protein
VNHFNDTDEQLRWFAFADDDERSNAEMVASLYRDGYADEANRLFGIVGHSPRMLRLVADAWEGKLTKLNQTSLNIVRAWIAAMELKGYNSDFPTRFPWVTVFEIRLAYARLRGFNQPQNETARDWLTKLEGRNKIPRHATVRATLTRCGLLICKDHCRRPRKRIRN